MLSSQRNRGNVFICNTYLLLNLVDNSEVVQSQLGKYLRLYHLNEIERDVFTIDSKLAL